VWRRFVYIYNVKTGELVKILPVRSERELVKVLVKYSTYDLKVKYVNGGEVWNVLFPT